MAVEVADLVRKLCPVLSEHRPAVIGAALADVLAIWLACHDLGNDAENATAREELLVEHMECVRQLIPINEEGMRQQRRRA